MMLLEEALFDPCNVLTNLYKTHGRQDFPLKAARYFHNIFRDRDALMKVSKTDTTSIINLYTSYYMILPRLDPIA
jgi:hypothetical protein